MPASGKTASWANLHFGASAAPHLQYLPLLQVSRHGVQSCGEVELPTLPSPAPSDQQLG